MLTGKHDRQYYLPSLLAFFEVCVPVAINRLCFVVIRCFIIIVLLCVYVHVHQMLHSSISRWQKGFNCKEYLILKFSVK